MDHREREREQVAQRLHKRTERMLAAQTIVIEVVRCVSRFEDISACLFIDGHTASTGYSCSSRRG